ncbi:diacylglycerol/lipid kinase family protein [Janibacter corallicola]|uniref:diacylglycerol/lipid kinase family protein n=1 Tax=Janibacter corallicola TaxID=415212 RepID=UPI000834CD18|nr:diacylglycerol kinase family protein [Janibacter corallicola]
MQRLLVLVNASAGSADRTTLETAVATLRSGADVEVRETADIDDLAAAISGRDGRELVIAGGDGSLNAFTTALCRTGGLGSDRPVVGLVPLGTGNDFARGVGLPADPREAARVVLDAPARPVDVLLDDSANLVANAVHIGVGEEAGRLAVPWKERLGRIGLGSLGYLIGGLAAGLGKQGRHLRVVADGETVSEGSRRLLQVAVTIGTSVGGGAEIAPDAEAGDGRADLVLSWAVPMTQRLRYAVGVASRRHTELDDVLTRRVRTVTVTGMNHDFAANSDGEALDPARERTWRVVPDAYRLHSRKETT